jgi:hypothetical protein
VFCFLIFDFLQKISQPVERSFPKPAILFHPLRGLLQGLGFQLDFMHTPITPASKKSRLLQHSQMF